MVQLQYKNPQGRDPDQLYRWGQDLVTTLRKNPVPVGSKYVFNVLNYGADPSGAIANFGAAFNAAMAACAAFSATPPAGSGVAYLNAGVVYIPAGYYLIGPTVMNWLPGCHILADASAYIKANVSITNMLTSGVGSANTLQGVTLRGGNWDGNQLVTKDGFAIPDFGHVHMTDFNMYNCSGNAGNGSIGGFIRLGGASTSISFEMFINNADLYNTNVPSIVTGNYGILADPSSTFGPTDCHFTNIVIQGCYAGVHGQFLDSKWNQVHCWCFPSQGSMNHGFDFTEGGATLIGCQVDSPVTSGSSAYNLGSAAGAQPFQLFGCGYFENSLDNLVNFANIGAGAPRVECFGNRLQGASGSNRIAADYVGTLTNINTLNDIKSNVVNQIINTLNNSLFVNGLIQYNQAWSTYTPTVTAGSGTFTTVSASGRFSNLGRFTVISIQVVVTTNGTAAGSVNVSLPVNASTTIETVLPGREEGNTGKMLQGKLNGAAQIAIFNYDNTYPAANGSTLNISGIYENA